MLLGKELSDFNSDMYLNLIMEFNNDIEFGELNKFSEEEDLKTLDVDQLMNRLEKSLSVSLDKVEKTLHKKLEASDLIRLCHIGIEIANAKFESSKKRRSAECDGSPPNKKKLMEIRNLNPIQNAIPIDLERRLTEMEYSSHTDSPGDLDDNKKRWLVVGICLHSILSPALRKYVEPVLTIFYKALKLSDQIDKQSHPRYLRKNGVRNVYLNYEPINMNKTTHGYRQHLYDYKVQNAVDLSKLFLPTHMAHYTAFDGSCDSSALLGMIDKIDQFPGNIRTVANDIRSNIRNDWAHCDFTVWDTVKYALSLQLIENIIYLLNFDAADEKEVIEELDKWRKNGASFLEGYTISFELVNEITQQIQVLVEYADVISKTSDKEFVKVHETLIHLTETLSQYGKRISTLENTVALQGKAIEVYGSVYDSDVHEIQIWMQHSIHFIKTGIFTDILKILEEHHCVLLTGVSGMGKTFTARTIALQLGNTNQYTIVPCISLLDITSRYKVNIRQVFVVDDLCGKYTANLNIIENWRKIRNMVNSILDKGMTKILGTCRTEVFKEEIFHQEFDVFYKNAYNLSDNYSFKDKLVIASKYLEHNDQMLSDITDVINKNKFSPLMCYLCSRHNHFDVNEFLSSPYDTFCKEWDNLKLADPEKFCVLLLCVIYNGKINEAILDISNELDKEEKKKLKDIFEWCTSNRGTSRAVIQARMNACLDTYFNKVDREYNVIHDRMFDFLCSYFGKTLLIPILKYADIKVICERVQLGSLQKAHGYFTIIVSEKDEYKYNDRIKTDLENGKIHCCLNNMQMKYKEYRIKFRDILKDLEYKSIRNLIKCKDDNGINSFIISCLRGYYELVDFFVSVGADVNAQVGFFTPLTAACHAGHVQMVETLLKKGSNINISNTQGETPLYTACVKSHYNLVNLLIENEADINKQNKFSRTPLHASCMSGHASIVSLLIDKGANVFQNKDLLISATLGGNDQIVERLISKDCCLNSVDIEGKTALIIACEEGYTNLVKLLIDNNADIYKVDSDGKTPLHAACCVGNNDIVKMLVNKNADINMLDVNLESPLHKACRKGSVDVILTLLDIGTDNKQINKDGHTPVHLAKTEGKIVNESILKALGVRMAVSKIEKSRIPITAYTSYSWTPLYKACVLGDIETVKSLIRYGASVNMQTISGEMPLIAACQRGYGFLMQTLLDERADINQALVCAVQKDYDRAVKILLYKGGDLDYKVDGKSLIKLACEHGSIKVIEILSDKGADFTEIDVNGQTLIHVACNTHSVELIQLLIDKGLDIGIPDKYGRFALFVSINNGFCELSKYLIQKRCTIAISEEDTKEALISVFESRNNELLNLLVANGYTDNLSNFNVTMLYHAHKFGFYESVKRLRNYGPYIKKRYKYGYTPMILADIGGNDDSSENLQNQMGNNYLNRSRTSISNERIGIVYTSEKKDKNTFIVDDIPVQCYFETSSIGTVEQYKDLFQACMYGDMKLVIRRIFLNKQFNVFFKPRDPYVSIWFEQTPLLLAIRRGHTEVCKFILRHGVNVNLTFEERKVKNDISLSTTILYGYTPLFAACQRKNYEIVDMLLEKGANLHKASYDACREGYLDTVRFFLQKGANVNLICRFGQTALYAACIGGHSTIVKFLVDQGAFIGSKFSRASIFDEPTCLHAAYLSDNDDIVKYLINRGDYVDVVGNFGRTLLHKACSDGNFNIVEMLVAKGFDINASDVYGSTPLIACVLQNIENNYQIRYLDSTKATASSIGHFDQEHEVLQLYTKLPYCDLKYEHPSENHYKIIQLLIENGADINKADKKGRTPLNLVLKIGEMKLTALLSHKVINENNLQERDQYC